MRFVIENIFNAGDTKISFTLFSKCHHFVVNIWGFEKFLFNQGNSFWNFPLKYYLTNVSNFKGAIQIYDTLGRGRWNSLGIFCFIYLFNLYYFIHFLKLSFWSQNVIIRAKQEGKGVRKVSCFIRIANYTLKIQHTLVSAFINIQCGVTTWV